jgi:quercetin dioxygenase-like cupin family protein
MGEVIRIGQLKLEFLATGEETHGQLTLFEMTVPTNARVPVAHHHREVEEVVYALDGVLTYTVDGKKHELRRGEHVVVPRGAVHHFCNLHEGDARALCVLTPASIGPSFFREVAAVVGGGGPPDPKRVGEVMLRHGLVPAP